jgi:ParB family chromosome partitioning protein
LKDHYGNHMTRMAERLKLSKGWLSKMPGGRSSRSGDCRLCGPRGYSAQARYALAQALDDGRLARHPQRASLPANRKPHERGHVAGRSIGRPAPPPRRAPCRGRTRRPAVVCGTTPAPGVGFGAVFGRQG